MKQSDFNEGYKALMQLSEMELPAKTSLGIALMIKRMQTVIETEQEVENKLIKRYQANVVGNGLIEFGDDSMSNTEKTNLKMGFGQEWNELMAADAPIDIEPVHVNIEDLGKIKPSLLAKLEGFVIFE